MNAERKAAAEATFEHHRMLAMRLDYATIDAFIDAFMQRALMGVSSYCCVPDVYQCMLCHYDAAHRAIVNMADFVISDSTVLQAARALRHKVPARRTLLGSQLMRALCARAQAAHVPVALIGGRDDKMLAEIRSRLLADYPDLQIVYAYAPPFRDLTAAEENTLLCELSGAGARLVFIGLGCPKQERWMARYRGRVEAAMIGVGAAFDTIGGRVRPMPDFVHRFGLEWLFRLLREPLRLYRRYLVFAPRFVWLLMMDWALAGGAAPAGSHRADRRQLR